MREASNSRPLHPYDFSKPEVGSRVSVTDACAYLHTIVLDSDRLLGHVSHCHIALDYKRPVVMESIRLLSITLTHLMKCSEQIMSTVCWQVTDP